MTQWQSFCPLNAYVAVNKVLIFFNGTQGVDAQRFEFYSPFYLAGSFYFIIFADVCNT